MKIDVILITYNQENYIRQAVESILMQKVNESDSLRIIVADDHSTDNTLSVIREYEKQSPVPFFYLPEAPNMGLQQNFKRAFAACDGDYTLVLEGDDYWCSPLHIEQHVRFLEEHKECSMSVNGIVLLWQESSLFELNYIGNTATCHRINLPQQIMDNHVGNHSACCYRTNILHTLPDSFFGDTFDDWLLGMWFCKYGFIAILPEYTSVYRKHAKGQWTGYTAQWQAQECVRRLQLDRTFFDEQYAGYFNQAIAQRQKKNHAWKKWVPPFVIGFVKLLLPPAMIQWINRK